MSVMIICCAMITTIIHTMFITTPTIIFKYDSFAYLIFCSMIVVHGSMFIMYVWTQLVYDSNCGASKSDTSCETW